MELNFKPSQIICTEVYLSFDIIISGTVALFFSVTSINNIDGIVERHSGNVKSSHVTNTFLKCAFFKFVSEWVLGV